MKKIRDMSIPKKEQLSVPRMLSGASALHNCCASLCISEADPPGINSKSALRG